MQKKALQTNFIIELLYILAGPTSKFFVFLGITPNTITFSSVLFTIAAGISLIIHLDPIYYIIFWSINIHLDFCDGTVARLTNNITKSVLRVDHLSDILKLSFIILSAGIHYQNKHVWLLATLAIASYLFSTILNHNLDRYKENNNDNTRNSKLFVIYTIYDIFFTINGHTLLWFLFIQADKYIAMIILIHFISMSAFNSIKAWLHLSKIPRN